MTAIHHRRTTCRLCNSANVELAFALAPSPLAEAYLPPERAHEADVRYPQDVYLCHDCGGVQQLDVIDATALFRDYQYTSATSPGLKAHFDRYATDVIRRFKPASNSLVCEIGSNDGTLLRFFKAEGMRVVGVDPAEKIAFVATLNGIPTYRAFMNAETAAAIVRDHGGAAIVCANNVLAHAEEPGVILDGVREVLADDGVFVFEVSYLPDLLAANACDWCYAEHSIYPTVGSYNSLFHRHGMEIFDVQRVHTKGGSIRCFTQKIGCPQKKWSSISSFMNAEVNGDQLYNGAVCGRIRDIATYRAFIRRVNAIRDQTVACLQEYCDRNLRVIGYGASATTTTLLHHFKIGGLLDYLVDDNPQRHGLVSPGYKLPVKSPQELYGKDRPDAVLVTAWRFAAEIMQRHRDYKGVWILPLPHFQEIAT
jgi:SAM-dependent methyltransferase